MKNQTGFTTLYILVGLLVLVLIGAGVYYFSRQNTPTQNIPLVSATPKVSSIPVASSSATASASPVIFTPRPARTVTSFTTVDMTDWKTYTNSDIKLTFHYPATWNIKELVEGNSNHRIELTGSEGQVDADWGSGFGGGCPDEDISALQIFGGVQNICISTDASGKEYWAQIYKEISSTVTFSLDGSANVPTQKNRNVVLTILSTFKFN